MKKQQGTSAPFQASGSRKVKSLIVERDRFQAGGCCGGRLFVAVGPSRQWTDMKVFGQHQQLDITCSALDVQVPGPPALLLHIGKPFHVNSGAVFGARFNGEMSCPIVVFGSPVHFKGVIARWKLQHNTVKEDKMVIIIDCAGHPSDPSTRILQLHANCDGLACVLIKDPDFKFATGDRVFC